MKQTTTTDTILKEFREKFRPFFANWATVCIKCNHIAASHYWNGGGNPANSGYDACHACGCVDYDKSKDFVDKILDYDEKNYSRFEQFLLSAISKTREETIEEIVKKYFNEPQIDTLKAFVERTKYGAHQIDTKVRLDGKDYWYETDWLRDIARELLASLKEKQIKV